MKWLIGFNDLDVEQRAFLTGNNMYPSLVERLKNEHIEGFPGSGKTILLMYAIAFIKDQNKDAKILFIEFTHSLIKMIQAALDELTYKEKKVPTNDINVVTYYDFVNHTSGDEHYDYILCDEVQDVPNKVLTKMKAQADRVLLAGDHNQSIYEKDPMWGLKPCNSTDIESILSPRITGLNIMHRLCKSIVNAINAFIPGMNIMSGKVPMVRKNVQIRLWKAANQQQEVEYIMKDARETIDVEDSVAILFPTHNKIKRFAQAALQKAEKPSWTERYDEHHNPDYESLNKHLDDNDIPMQVVANGYGNFVDKKNLIVLTTYHSSKGLDFDKVFLPFCNHTDEYSRYDEAAQRLFMVAMTRSRKDLIISYSSMIDKFVEKFSEQCQLKILGDDLPSLFGTDEDNGFDEDDLFK